MIDTETLKVVLAVFHDLACAVALVAIVFIMRRLNGRMNKNDDGKGGNAR